MNFLKDLGKALGEAVSAVGEKSRQAAYVSRIRSVISCEEKAAEREYLALGRYYYNNLRDKNNPVTEAHCAELEAIEGRLEKALNQLEDFYQSMPAIEEEGEAEEITLDDVESYDADPMAESPAEETPAEAEAPVVDTAPAEPGENDSLPFEG